MLCIHYFKTAKCNVISFKKCIVTLIYYFVCEHLMPYKNNATQLGQTSTQQWVFRVELAMLLFCTDLKRWIKHTTYPTLVCPQWLCPLKGYVPAWSMSGLSVWCLRILFVQRVTITVVETTRLTIVSTLSMLTGSVSWLPMFSLRFGPLVEAHISSALKEVKFVSKQNVPRCVCDILALGIIRRVSH